MSGPRRNPQSFAVDHAPLQVILVAAFLLGPFGCGGSDSTASDAGMAGDGGAALAGTVRDRAGEVVSGAKVEVGAVSVFSDAQGRYTLAGLGAGAGTLKVSRDWFKPLEAPVNVAASGATTMDLTIDELPLKVEAADRALVTTHAASFDWTKQTLSLAVVARPSRRDFDNAVYFHNPALYRNTANEPPLAPMPAPQIAGGVASGFSFPIGSGASSGQQALDLASIRDSVTGTTLGASEPAEFMMWTPMINWLVEWDPARAADLRLVGVSVRQQSWGGTALRPQEIEKAYLDGAGALWVKVVFASFVQLGAGIADDDGDGLKEIYAKVPAAFVSAEITQKLTAEYAGTLYSTHGLSKQLARSLNELYSTTAAQVERTLGQPFEVPGLGTITYPFVVLRHAGGQRNVILVSPAP